MSPISHRTCTPVALVTTAALAVVLAGCSSGPVTPADKVAASAAAAGTSADKLSAAVKAMATEIGFTTRQVLGDATATTEISPTRVDGTRERPATVWLSSGPHKPYVAVEGVKGYKGMISPTDTDSHMIVVDGGVCTSVRWSDTSLTDVIVKVLPSCPPDD